MKRGLLACLTALATVSLGTSLVPPVSAGTVAQDSVVSEDPVDWTPHVLDGQVEAIAVVAGHVVVGGEFRKVQETDGPRTYARRNIFAYDARTGRISRDFAPRVDGVVHALAPGPNGTVVVGGEFTHAGSAPARGITRLDVRTGKRAEPFDATLRDGYVRSVAVRGRWLYIGGRFSTVNGVARSAVARLDVRDGDVDPDFRIHPSDARKGALKVQQLAVSPDGSRLVIDGTFARVNGRRRPQIALVDTATSPARLLRWKTESYAPRCASVLDTYMRDIDFAPDGSYFVVVTSGGAHQGTLCDTVARWQTDSRRNARPVWVNHTGGDSLYAVAATGAAVYVGGHPRWLNNPHGHDSRGPGAVSRPGIGAVNPRTGKALPWNPTRTRGHGVEAFLTTRQGLYVGSDTEELGHEHHGRVGMFPLHG